MDAYAEQAKAKGLLFLLLTGGEPFLYPEFRTLYARLKAMGLIVSVNTNSTLLHRKLWSGCRRFRCAG